MDKFWELLEKSILIQGLVTLAFVGGFIALTLMGQEIPDLYKDALLLILGFWFGTYSQKQVQSLGKKK